MTERTVRVMLSDERRPESRVRVDADLGVIRSLPVFEQERIVDRVLTEARDRVLAALHPEAVPA